MNTESRFRCPNCNFAIFNRRLAKCESCSTALPPELLLSPEQLNFFEADHQRMGKMRQNLARKAAEAKEKRAKKWQG